MTELGARIRELGQRHALAPIVLGVVLYSTGPVFVRASSVSGPVFSFWRLWFGVGVFALALLWQWRRRGIHVAPRGWRWSLLAGTAFGTHQLLMFTAVKLTSVADVTLIAATAPVVTGLLALPFFPERPGRGFWAWSTVAMAGSAVVVRGAAGGPEGDPLGAAFALANVVFFAIFFLLSKRSRAEIGVLPFLTGVMVTAASLVTVFVVVTGEPAATATTTDLVYALIVAAGPGFLGHVVMTWPLRWIPANIPPVMRLGTPVLASTWAWVFLGDAVGAWQALGGVITAGGVAGAVLSRSGRELVRAEQAAATAQVRGGG